MIVIKKHRTLFFSLLPVLLTWYLLVCNSLMFGSYVTPFIVLGLIYLIGFGVLFGKFETVGNEDSASNSIVLMGVWILSAIALLIFSIKLFQLHPIDISKSDIIPLIEEVYYTRWIKGTFVYADVKGYDYINWVPNYLPLHWMPFIPAFFFHFDPRFIPLILFLCVQFYFVCIIHKLNLSLAEKITKAILPLLFLGSIMYFQKQSFVHTIELLIVSYYSLMAIGLLLKKEVVFITGSVTTLLSRYMGVFFLPIHLMYHAKTNMRKTLFMYSVILFAILLIYILPYVSLRPGLFFEGAAAYDLAAMGEWDGQAWQAVGDKPYQLFQGFGFAALYYRIFQSFDLIMRIQIIKYSMVLVMCINIVFWTWMRKRISIDNTMAMPAILLITLALFLSFVTVPYNYLFWTVLFLLPIVSMRTRWFK